MSGPPYTDHFTRLLRVTPERTPFFGEFVMQQANDPTAELAFHAGGHLVEGSEPVEICFDSVVNLRGLLVRDGLGIVSASGDGLGANTSAR